MDVFFFLFQDTDFLYFLFLYFLSSSSLSIMEICIVNRHCIDGVVAE